MIAVIANIDADQPNQPVVVIADELVNN